MALYNLEDVFREIKLCKPEGYVEKDFREWLFEYACRTCEFEGIKPETRPDYLNLLMVTKAYGVKQYLVTMYHTINTNPKKALQFIVPSYAQMSEMVRQEHLKNQKQLGP